MRASAAAVRQGIKARKMVPYPLGGKPLPLPAVGEDGAVTFPEPDPTSWIPVDVRTISSLERRDALARAYSYTKGKGIEPREGEPVYDLSVMGECLALACLDHDSAPDKPEAFFDGLDHTGAPILVVDGSGGTRPATPAEHAMQLDGDRLAYLYEQWVAWEATCNPRRLNLSPGEYVQFIGALAMTEDGDDRPFVGLPLATQRICTRIMARQLWTSPGLKLPVGSSPSSNTTS